MASDESHSSGLPQRPSRQPPTLDLKAREVQGQPETSEIREQIREIREQIEGQMRGEASTPAEAGQDEAGATAAPQAASADPSQPASGEAGAAEGGGPEAAPADPAAAAAVADPEAGPPAEPPPAAAKPDAPPAPRKSGGGWFAGLLAGAIAGGVVAGSALYAVPKYVLPQPPAPPQVDLGPLTSRIAALEGRPVPPDPAASIAALTRRVAQMDDAVKAAQEAVTTLKGAAASAPAPSAPAPAIDTAALSALGKRVDGLEKGVGALQASLDTLKSTPPAPPKALMDAVSALTGGADATQGVLADLQREIGGLKAAQAGLESAMKTASAAALGVAQQAQAQLQTQVQALGPRLDAVDKAVSDAAAGAGLGRAAASMTVLAALRETAASGRPFTAELATARTVLGARASGLDPLASAAASGLATPAQLAQRLVETGAAALAASVPQERGDASLVSRFMASAEKLVKVRPVDSVERSGEEGLDRAASALRAGQLDDALAIIARLPPPVQDALKPVVAQIEARRTVLATLSTLYQQAAASAAGKAP